jgi:hypothetical protein
MKNFQAFLTVVLFLVFACIMIMQQKSIMILMHKNYQLKWQHEIDSLNCDSIVSSCSHCGSKQVIYLYKK